MVIVSSGMENTVVENTCVHGKYGYGKHGHMKPTKFEHKRAAYFFMQIAKALLAMQAVRNFNQ